MATVSEPRRAQRKSAVTRGLSPLGRRSQPRRRGGMKPRPNYIAGIFSLVWLVIILAPIYVLVKGSFQTQSEFSSQGPLAIPHHLTLNTYHRVIKSGFLHYFVNSGIITAGTVLIVVLLAPPAAYAIVRNQGRIVGVVFRILLMGLAVPATVVVVPLFYLFHKVGLYDSLLGVILPTAAFALPICTIILTGAMRDVTRELYEAMALDGANSWKVFRSLVLPLSKGGIATIVVFSALQGWNGFIFPLILIQSSSKQAFTLALYNFQVNNDVDVPAIAGAVVLSMVPILLVYLFGRSWLIKGLMGVGGK